MLIRSKLHRPGGTRVDLGKGKDTRRYHFKPIDPKHPDDDPQVDHVVDVSHPDDVATFLAIKEGYEVHPSELAKPAAKTAAAQAEQTSDAALASAQASADAAAAPVAKAAKAKNYKAMGKPDLIKLVAQRTGKAPHGTTRVEKLIEQLEQLDADAATKG